MSYQHHQSFVRKLLTLAVAVGLNCSVGLSHAEDLQFSIEEQNMASALNTLSEQANLQLLFSKDDVRGISAKRVTGNMSSEQALKELLAGTDLVYEYSSANTVVVKKSQKAIAEAIKPKQQAAIDEIRVTEVMVTAQKREERLLDVPMSITALSGETIDTAGMQNIIDLSYAVPNLSVREEGPGLQTIVIRGIGNFIGSSSLVGLYLDEVPVSAVPAAEINLQTLDLARVEVLKGPQGSLYGQGAVGGTIRFITKAPSFDGIEGNVGISLYDTHKGDMSQEVTGVLNLPVVDDVLALRMAGTYKNKGGWIDRPAVNEDNYNDNELANVRVKALWQATDRLSINAMTNHHRNEAGGFSYVNLQPLSASQFQTGADPTLSPGVEDDYDLYNLTLYYQFDFATLTSSTSYIDLGKEFLNRSQFLELAALGSFESAISVSYEVEAFSQELRLSSSEEQRFTWTVGAFYSDLKTHQISTDLYRTLNGMPLPLIPLAGDSTEYSESAAVFGDLAYALTEQLTLGVGTRYFEDSRELTNHLNGVTFEEDFDNISSRVYLSYALSDQANLYASVSEGFRSGGFNASATTTLPQAYEPDEVISYEVGVKANLFDQRLSAELSLYYADYTDQQGFVVSGLLGTSESGVINGGDAEVKGVEWLLRWVATDALSLGFSGNITDAEVVGLPSAGITPDKNPGDPLDFVPDYNYSVIADYHFSWSAAVPGYVQLSYHRQGPSSLISRLVGALDPVSEADAIGFLNLQLGARFQKFDLQLFARNLLNEDRPTGPDVANGQRFPQARPRSIGVNLNYQF